MGRLCGTREKNICNRGVLAMRLFVLMCALVTLICVFYGATHAPTKGHMGQMKEPHDSSKVSPVTGVINKFITDN